MRLIWRSADVEKQGICKMIEQDPLKLHMQITLKSRWYFNNILQNIQKAKYPGLADEAAALKSATESIK
jgi:hypothetical protein